MHELLYRSRGVVDLAPEEMETFLGASRTRNTQAGITGMLLQIHDAATGSVFFVQLLEGPDPVALEQTYERISRDELHFDLQVLHRGERPVRLFGDWSMRAGVTSAESALRAIATNNAELDGNGDDAGTAAATWDLLESSHIARSLLIIAAAQQGENR
ncbi:BLUF domain-containing protein [Kineosporia succinea]|uniref:BLUF domain-containing protein n=1 Tax=Kineosporia succinea TaxID=84632 RepID=A0ABT9PAB6_9ACTN|nr:BLUF domain-containing protein [Kineosporia succinea]MDP9829632.1 hypothetical protein [Kineosporia succinea]